MCSLKEALYCESIGGGRVRCRLCPNECVIEDGKAGSCGVRKNVNGKLYSLIYGQATSVALDPIEKKPLYHFHPREFILSVGTKGCNFHCPFCQNWTISQESDSPSEEITPEGIVEKAKKVGSFGIAYTYNEPFIWYEFVFDTAKLAHENGLKNVLVTNGYVNQAPLEVLLPYIDAMNIDLKSVDSSFYQRICKGKLEPVLENIKTSAAGCHIELTNLVIPTLNDSKDHFHLLTDWIWENLGPRVPLHFSRYFPCYKTEIPPTPLSTLKLAQDIAKEKLKYVYLGNVVHTTYASPEI